MCRVVALLVALAALHGTLTLAAPPHVHAGGGGKAYYILFQGDIDDPIWPRGYTDYELFVVSPQNVTAAHIAKVKRTVPGAKLVAYWDARDIPIQAGCSTGHVMGDLPGRNCTSYPHYTCGPGAYTTAIQAAFPSRLLLNAILSNGSRTPVCHYPGLAMGVWHRELADTAVRFLAAWLRIVPFDGLYVDNSLSDLVFWRSEFDFLSTVGPFDSNADGKVDTAAQAIEQYASWRPYFMAQLRRALGPSALLLGNTGGPLSDPALNGITVEMESCLDAQSCTNALLGQQAASAFAPPVSILWLTHAEDMPPQEQCEAVAHYQQLMPWVLQGTDFFDGSHIVCNNTAPSSAAVSGLAPAA